MNEIDTVGVLGGGLMGSGIAQVCAASGYKTIVREVSAELCARARAAIGKSFDKAIEKAKATTEQRDAALARISFTTSINDLADASIIIEAVVEDLAVKSEMFRDLDGICSAETIFASNTSSLTIAEIAAATGRPDRFVGMHFFNPVPVMKLVEVV
ncbi:MAG TPA: 3-hydroxyacyl-CoA dehydrogenase NAD-binding domain-containing protein, partial [Gemmatimonadaceae bacterium]